MSLNWREIELILSELPLVDSMIQRVHQIGFHQLLLELHNRQSGSWQLYIEVGTPSARLHQLSGGVKALKKQKQPKLQRFVQYCRAHIESMRITEVKQLDFERIVILTLSKQETLYYLILRFFSGAQANVIICDQQMIIKELLFRRPHLGDAVAHQLILPKSGNEGAYHVRPYPSTSSFNRYIEELYKTPQKAERPLKEVLEHHYEKKVSQLQQQLDAANRRIEAHVAYASYKKSADLLASNRHLLLPNSTWAQVYDHQKNETVSIAVDPKLSVELNIQAYYKRYQKGKKSYQMAVEEQKRLLQALSAEKKLYEKQLVISEQGSAEEQETLLTSVTSDPNVVKTPSPFQKAPGLQFTSGQFTLLVGRNASENDQLLRHWVRGNDWWLHSRDAPGSYVFIKSIANKSIPLETLLDAGSLALLYSKMKSAGKGEVYYTQIKYLRRVKGGKKGLVIPTQEKNLWVNLDEKRLQRLFQGRKKAEEEH
ncbi:MAG: NFACT RNA binding domain-containing protein [Sphaerochaetaceae bacterium]